MIIILLLRVAQDGSATLDTHTVELDMGNHHKEFSDFRL